MTLRSNQDVENEKNNVEIELTEPVSLTFSLKYLVNFCKAQPLSDRVKVCLSNEVPLLVEYGLAGTSYLRFYLAPKVRSLISKASSCCVILTLGYRLATRNRNNFAISVWHEDHEIYHYVGTRHGCMWTRTGKHIRVLLDEDPLVGLSRIHKNGGRGSRQSSTQLDTFG